jgi:hypothetical protein
MSTSSPLSPVIQEWALRQNSNRTKQLEASLEAYIGKQTPLGTLDTKKNKMHHLQMLTK